MKAQSNSDDSDDVGFKPGDLSPASLLFFKIILAVGISLPILLCGYGLITYFFFGIR